MNMKRTIRLSAVLLAAALLLGGCESGKTIIQQGGDTKVSKGLKDVVCAEQGFTTKCLDVFDTAWDAEDGLYIYTKTSGSIPYVLIWRYQNTSMNVSEFINNYLIPDIKASYGSRLIETSEVKEWEVGGSQLPGVQFTYTVDSATIRSLRVFRATADGFVSFNCKWVDDESSVVREALDTAVKNFKIGTASNETQKSGGSFLDDLFKSLKITKTEAAQVKYTKYTDSRGYFTMEIPSGWKVEVGLKPDLEFDIISYAIAVYDPKNPERQLYFNLNNAGVLKTKDAYDWYKSNYGANNEYAKFPWLEEQSTAGYFAAVGSLYGYEDFTVIEDQGKNEIGNDVLIARSTWNGRKCEGVYSAMIDLSQKYMVQKNPFDFFGPQVDVWPVVAYAVVIINAAEEEIIEWKPVLDHCLSTLKFTDAFQRDRKQAWKQLMGTMTYMSASAGEISDMIMDSWEKRNTTYDVLSQKQSDATLGYERVYDTETKEYYRAEVGFGDWYKGERYQVVTDDKSYLEVISGYINWK